MTRRDRVAVTALCLTLVAAATATRAQDYPTKPVTIICDAAAGSTPDVVTRFFAEGLGRIWEQQIITVNRPGGGGSIGARAAAEALPDGYTLYMPALSDFVALPGGAPNLPLQLPRDFVALGFTSENPMFFAVNPALGVNTLPELIALAKKSRTRSPMRRPGSAASPTSPASSSRCAPTSSCCSCRTRAGRRMRCPMSPGRGWTIVEGSGGGGCGEGRSRQGDRGRFGQAAARLPRSSDRRGDAAGLRRHRLAGDGGAERHARADPAQGEPGHGDRRRKRRREEEASPSSAATRTP